jgi:hypothetical protein
MNADVEGRVQFIYDIIRADNVDVLRTLDIVDAFKYISYNHRASPLYFATAFNAKKCVQWLLSSGMFDVDQACVGCTPLYNAVFRHDPMCVKILLDAGANVEFINTHGESVMTRACRNNGMNIIYMLVDYGAQLQPPQSVSPHTYGLVRTYYNARLQRRARQRAFLAAVLSTGSMNKDLVRLFSIITKK